MEATDMEEPAVNKRIAMNWAIALAVAAVYLSVSILFDSWAYSWLIWVAYAVYRFVF